MGEKRFQTYHHRPDTKHEFTDVRKGESHTWSVNLPNGEQLTVCVFPSGEDYLVEIHQYDNEGYVKEISGGPRTGCNYGKLEKGFFRETNRLALFHNAKKPEFEPFTYSVGEHFLAALYNGDVSGLNEEESKTLYKFQGNVIAEYGAGHWGEKKHFGFGKCEVCGLESEIYEIKWMARRN